MRSLSERIVERYLIARKAEKYVNRYLKDSTIAAVWHALPTGILVSFAAGAELVSVD